jgi:endoglucanase
MSSSTPNGAPQGIDLALLENLSNAIGVAGGEAEVRQLIIEQIRDRVVDLHVDSMGNVLARRIGTGKNPLRVLLTAHMDEPGFFVMSADDDGLLTVETVGELDGRYAAAKRVLVGAEKTAGVLLWTPIHHSRNPAVVSPNDMVIDTGGVGGQAGDRAAYAPNFGMLNDRIARGKAFESRAACAILIALIKGETLPCDLHVAFTTQKELGGRGAVIAARRVQPQVAIGLGGIAADDFPRDPDEPDHHPVLKLGGGPAVALGELHANTNRQLLGHALRTAEQQQIAHQLAHTNQETEANTMSIFSGAASFSLQVPVRYPTSPAALIDVNDVDATLRLLQAVLRTLDPAILEHTR